MVRRRPRYVSDDERRLWRAAMHDTEPLASNDRQPQTVQPTNPQTTAAQPTSGQPKATQAIAVPKKTEPRIRPRMIETKHKPVSSSGELDRQKPVDIDRRSWQKLKRGDVKLDGRIDLHGLTQAQAHERLNGFLMAMQARGARCVLVITGLGRGESGVLREMTPRWLSEPGNRARIVNYTQAQLKHGGAGALYVLLKRIREKG